MPIVHLIHLYYLLIIEAIGEKSFFPKKKKKKKNASMFDEKNTNTNRKNNILTSKVNSDTETPIDDGLSTSM
jgi:hypothetical protein